MTLNAYTVFCVSRLFAVVVVLRSIIVVRIERLPIPSTPFRSSLECVGSTFDTYDHSEKKIQIYHIVQKFHKRIKIHATHADGIVRPASRHHSGTFRSGGTFHAGTVSCTQSAAAVAPLTFASVRTPNVFHSARCCCCCHCCCGAASFRSGRPPSRPDSGTCYCQRICRCSCTE